MASPLGHLLLASQAEVLVGLWFEDQTGIPAWAQHATRGGASGVLAQTVNQVHEYLSGQRQAFDVPIQFYAGTPFQQAVWRALQAIPYGQTTSYTQIAATIGKPQAVRAAGAAIGRNPLGIVIPCHRVVGMGGSMTGYTGGVDRKRALLALEARRTQGV